MDLLKHVPEKWKFWKKDNKGNVLVGDNDIKTEGGEVENNTLVGKNTVVSKARPGQAVSISGNRMFGKNRITITSESDEDSD
jgi:hypothetical protein